MDEQERANDELVTRFCKEWDAPYLTTEAMAPYFTDDAVYHNIPLPPIEGGAAIAGMLGGRGAPDEERGSKNLGWVVHNQAANGDVVLNERTDSFEVAGQRWGRARLRCLRHPRRQDRALVRLLRHGPTPGCPAPRATAEAARSERGRLGGPVPREG